MAESKRTFADGAALIALCIVSLAVNIAVVSLTEFGPIVRWGLTVLCGVIAAAATYAIVSRSRRARR